MIQRDEIDAMAQSLDVNPADVEKDYVHGWLLSLLYSSSDLASRLVLKGGNCLRKGYFEHARYSNDLDFTTPVGIEQEVLHRELNAICSALTERTGVSFDLSKTRVVDKRNVDTERKVSEARLYFRDFYGKESHIILAVKMDVTQFDRIYLPVQQRSLIHPYSDAEACQTAIRCVKLEEVLATKMRCLLQRKHIADLFDLVYASVVKPDLDINRAELISTFFKITIFGRSPAIAKGLFLDLPMEALGLLWEKYICCPNISWFDFDKAQSNFFDLIHVLIPGNAEREFSTIYFPSSLRIPILEAADNHTMVRMAYDGVERLVEPYELAFKIPAKDGIAREYFYGFDTTGGRTSGPSLKSFLPGRVQSVEVTDLPFTPRYEIKTSKSGGAETLSRFYGKGRRGLRSYLSSPRSGKSRRAFMSGGITYTVQCPYCHKRFSRKTMDTKLNKHKNAYGQECGGRTGFIV